MSELLSIFFYERKKTSGSQYSLGKAFRARFGTVTLTIDEQTPTTKGITDWIIVPSRRGLVFVSSTTIANQCTSTNEDTRYYRNN
jgi:hypothetical protein